MTLRAIDLFCGTGGFSRGAHAAGFQVAAAFDKDPILTSSFTQNFPETKLVLTDLAAATGAFLKEHAGGPVDLMFGGPPCQGFSAIGRRDKADIRRTLLSHFFRLVDEARPRAFVMENVQGLGFAEARPELDEAIGLLHGRYELIGPLVLDASDYGAATKRKRLFVVGYDPNRCSPMTANCLEAVKTRPATVAEALSGLASALPIDLENDIWEIPSECNLSDYGARSVRPDRRFTGNRRTKHAESTAARFATVPQGGLDKVGRHPRLAWSGQCPTLRAGTGADVGSYQSVRPLHPDEARVITVREAARLQGFPDEHVFHPTIWHSFRMIGNSVSPPVAEAVLRVLHDRLERAEVSREAA